MTAAEFKRWLKARGCIFEESRGKGGHIIVRKGSRFTTLPMHGSAHELGQGLVNAVKKQLGLK